MGGLIANIRRRDQATVSDLALDREVPRIYCRTLGIRLLRHEISVLDEWGISTEGRRERIAARIGGPGVREVKRPWHVCERVPERRSGRRRRHDLNVRKIVP